MKSLVVYYSRTGKTRDAAIKIAEKLNSEIEQIIEKKKRKGLFGWLSGGRDALKQVQVEIEPVKKKPEDYDLVIIGTPVWASTMVPAIRTYLNSHKIKKSAIFCTAGGTGVSNALGDMLTLLLDTKLVAKMGLTGSDIKKGADEKINEFIEKIKAPGGI